ncbi:hypothetical protein HK105_203196 [Polyrhizophydium stewartii]|uniref:RRM domain-containing protein n=1 Tax=Polyrhizophydium stewartii TaxID=2732419 RepID=A0ABR4NCA5_9FUNG
MQSQRRSRRRGGSASRSPHHQPQNQQAQNQQAQNQQPAADQGPQYTHRPHADPRPMQRGDRAPVQRADGAPDTAPHSNHAARRPKGRGEGAVAAADLAQQPAAVAGVGGGGGGGGKRRGAAFAPPAAGGGGGGSGSLGLGPRDADDASDSLSSCSVCRGGGSSSASDPNGAPAAHLLLQSNNQSQQLRTSQRGQPQACLFVASLSAARSDVELQESVTNHFAGWGELLNVKVLKDWAGRPYAFVQFRNVADAQRALVEANHTVVDGRHIRIEQAKVNRTLYVARCGDCVAEDEIRAVLETFGPIEEMSVLHDTETGLTKGCGFVKFCFREDAIAAFAGLRSVHRWSVDWASSVDRIATEIDRTSVFVGNLNEAEVTEDAVRRRFGVYGDIAALTLVNKYPDGPTARPAFAFVRYASETAAELAVLSEAGQRWMDRVLRVQFREVGAGTSGMAGSGGFFGGGGGGAGMGVGMGMGFGMGAPLAYGTGPGSGVEGAAMGEHLTPIAPMAASVSSSLTSSLPPSFALGGRLGDAAPAYTLVPPPRVRRLPQRRQRSPAGLLVPSPVPSPAAPVPVPGAADRADRAADAAWGSAAESFKSACSLLAPAPIAAWRLPRFDHDDAAGADAVALARYELMDIFAHH